MDVAAELGLTVRVEHAGLLGTRRIEAALAGRIDGVELTASVTVVDDSLFGLDVRVRAELPQPLGMGLELKAKSPWMMGVTELVETFLSDDLAYEIDARVLHLDEGRNLVGDEVERLLVHACHNDHRPHVTDHVVELRGIQLGGRRQLLDLLRLAPRLANALSQRRAHIPRSEHDQRIITAWSEVAAGLDGARFDDEGLVMRGELPGLRWRANVAHVSFRVWHTLFELELERPLPVTLRLTEVSATSRWKLWLNPDVRVDDEEFDATFVVRGEPTDTVRKLLSPAVRAPLIDLARRTAAVVTEGGLVCRIEHAVIDPSELRAVVRAGCRAAEALLAGARRSEGPYR